MLFSPKCCTHSPANLHSKMAFFMAFACAVLSFTPSAIAQPVVVDSLPGQGWFHIPQSGIDTTGAVALVNGPDTPPAGNGSLQLTVNLVTDKAAVGNTTAFPLLSGPHLINTLTASFSTYVPTGGTTSQAPVLKFGGYQQSGTTDFTTLNLEPVKMGTVTPGSWQTWSLDDSSMVWDTHTGTTCPQATPCTFAFYKTTYPDAHFVDIQLALGSGLAGPVSGYIDNVTVGADQQAFSWDFEKPAPAAVPVDTAWFLGLSALFLGFIATRARRFHFFR